MIARIPIAHLHGGETTEGAFDEAIRHSITKMAYWHFTAAEPYRKRVIQLGESPDRVFNVGGLGVENIKRLKLLSKPEFEESIGFKLAGRNLLVTYHPVTLESASATSQFQALLNAIDMLENTNIIFTKANSDTDGRVINQMIDNYAAQNPHKSIAFTSLGQLRYLSALQYVDVIVGNSSSGLLEVPSFKKATINIGDRQTGRLKAQSIIDCAPTEQAIKKAVEKAFSDEFKTKLSTTVNPYGEGEASTKILPIIKRDISVQNLKKSFYDLQQSSDL
jgi:GDP/UDP-N,N'-diacetylbacillosamine 2-epimerase (hydrolysing)